MKRATRLLKTYFVYDHAVSVTFMYAFYLINNNKDTNH